MNTLNRFKAPLVLAAVLALPVLTNCSAVSDAQGAVCCTEYKPGASIDVKIGGSAQAQVAVQAVADFQGIASAAITDLTTACKSMAQDLDASKADLDAAEAAGAAAKDPSEVNRLQMNAYCALAVKAIGTVKASAGGTLTINVVPPKCEASVSAKANCQAKCDVSGKCDIKANPPTCKGGSLSVACKGDCTAKAGATMKCEGKCAVGCKGSCTVEGGIKCEGKCEGTCEGAGGAGTSGLDATGKCTGTCKGTCSATAPGVECTGSCNGECGGTCSGSATASVKCDGECKADFEPLKCEGGTLEGGCKVDAKCDGNCSASVSAKAECTPPEVSVSFSGAANIDAAAKLKGAFEANLGVVYAFKARLEGMAALTATITGNADAVVEIKASCIPIVIASALAAAEDVGASVKVTGSLVASAK